MNLLAGGHNAAHEKGFFSMCLYPRPWGEHSPVPAGHPGLGRTGEETEKVGHIPSPRDFGPVSGCPGGSRARLSLPPCRVPTSLHDGPRGRGFGSFSPAAARAALGAAWDLGTHSALAPSPPVTAAERGHGGPLAGPLRPPRPPGEPPPCETNRPSVFAVHEVIQLEKKTNSCGHPGPKGGHPPVLPGQAVFSVPLSETQELGAGLCWRPDQTSQREALEDRGQPYGFHTFFKILS